ncbi:response regulator [bacterium]|jgi:DNA-binding response OmpR family regulator|nr:response regulator [bacterium]
MPKKVLDVGNCNPDHGSLTHLLQSNFDVDVSRTHGMRDTLELLQTDEFDLILVNRLMDRDGSSGLEIIKKIKEDANTIETPVMMITNFPDHQAAAVSVGAIHGFGKSELHEPDTLRKLEACLS